MKAVDVAVIVAYLPALAITAVTGMDVNLAIVAVTLVTILYCTSVAASMVFGRSAASESAIIHGR